MASLTAEDSQMDSPIILQDYSHSLLLEDKYKKRVLVFV